MSDSIIYAIWGRWWAARLAEDQYHDIYRLWKMRVVAVEAKGKSITEIYVDVKSRLDRSLKVLIPHGTYFKARGTHQNMATRKEIVFVLEPMGMRFLNVPACCLNAKRPIPGKTDAFRGVQRVTNSVEKYLREAERSGEMVTQAGVWAITDHYGRSQIKNRLTTTFSDGRSRPGISDHEIDQAKEILDRLGIDSNIR
jgi:hypothetical protein